MVEGSQCVNVLNVLLITQNSQFYILLAGLCKFDLSINGKFAASKSPIFADRFNRNRKPASGINIFPKCPFGPDVAFSLNPVEWLILTSERTGEFAQLYVPDNLESFPPIAPLADAQRGCVPGTFWRTAIGLMPDLSTARRGELTMTRKTLTILAALIVIQAHGSVQAGDGTRRSMFRMGNRAARPTYRVADAGQYQVAYSRVHQGYPVAAPAPGQAASQYRLAA